MKDINELLVLTIIVLTYATSGFGRTLFWEGEALSQKDVRHYQEASKDRVLVLNDTVAVDFESPKSEKIILWVRAFIDANNSYPIEVINQGRVIGTIFKSKTISEEYEKKKKKTMTEFFNKGEEKEEDDGMDELMGVAEKKTQDDIPKFEEHRRPEGFYWDSAVVSVVEGGNSIAFRNASGITGRTMVDAVVITSDMKYFPYIFDFVNYGEPHIRVVAPKGDGEYEILVTGLAHSPRFYLPGVKLSKGKLSLGKPSPWYSLCALQKDEYPASGYGYRLDLIIRPTEDFELDEDGKFTVEFSLAPNPEYIYRTIEIEGLTAQFALESMNEAYLTEELAWKHYETAESMLNYDTELIPLSYISYLIAGSGATGASAGIENRVLRMIGINTTHYGIPTDIRRLMGWKIHDAVYSPPTPIFGAEDFYDTTIKIWKKRIYEYNEEDRADIIHYNLADEPGPHLSLAYFTGMRWELKDGIATEYAGHGRLFTKRLDFKNFILEAEYYTESPILYVLLFSKTQEGWNWNENWKKESLLWVLHRPIGWMELANGGSYVEGLGVRGSNSTYKPEMKKWHKIAAVVYGKEVKLYLDGKMCSYYELKQEPTPGGIGFSSYEGLLKLRNIKIYKAKSFEDEPTYVDESVKKEEEEEDEDDLDKALAKDDLKSRLIFEEKFEKDLSKWYLKDDNQKYIDLFREYLKEEGYKPSDFGKKNWTEVDGIPREELAQTSEDSFLYYATVKYWSKVFSLYFKASTDGIEKALGRKVPTSINFMGHGFFFGAGNADEGQDWTSIGRERGVTSPGTEDWMGYGGWRFGSLLCIGYMVDVLRGGSKHHDGWTTFHTVWPERERMFTLIGHRVRHIIYWVYGPSYAFTEGMWSEMPGVYRTVSLASRSLSKVDESAKDAVVKPSKLGLVYGVTGEIWKEYQSFWGKMGIYFMLHHGQHPVTVLSEEDLNAEELSKYKVIILADRYLERRRAEPLKKWVEEGGILIADLEAGTYDERNMKLNFLSGFGVKATGSDTSANGFIVHGTKGKLLDGETLEVDVARIHVECSVPNEVVAEFSDKKPAIIKVNKGKGAVYVYSYSIGGSYYRHAQIYTGFSEKWRFGAEWRGLLKPIREYVTPCVEGIPGGVEADVWDYPDGNIIVFNDWRWTGVISTGFVFRTNFEVKEVESINSGKIEFECKKSGDGYVTEVKNITIKEADIVMVRKSVKTITFAVGNLPYYDAKKSPEYRGVVLWLGGFGRARITDKDIVSGFKDEDEWVRVWALDASGRLRKSGLIGEMEKLCKDSSYWVRMRAIWAITKCDWDRGHKLAKEMLKDKNPLVRKYAVSCLDGKNNETPGITEKMIADIDPRVRTLAIRKLYESGHKPEWDFVKKLIEKGEWEALSFVPELWKREPAMLKPYVMQENNNWSYYVFVKLADRKDDYAETLLKEFMKTGTKGVKYWATACLGNLWEGRPEKADLKLLTDCFGKDEQMDQMLEDSLFRITGKTRMGRGK